MTNEEKRYFALHYICNFFLTPYDWGGESGMGIDCSGLGQEYLRSVGMDPEGDQAAQGLYRHFRDKKIEKPTAGALVFYGKSTTKITHVAICMTDELIIEAGGGGRRTTNEARAHAHKAFVRMRPIDRRSDLVAICDPFQA